MTKAKEFTLQTGRASYLDLLITSERVNNDVNGNPVYLVTVMTKRYENGEIHFEQWSPSELGSKRKDRKVRIQTYDGHIESTYIVFDKLQDAYDKLIFKEDNKQ